MRKALLILMILSLAVSVTGCAADRAEHFDFNSIQSYKDIPGVTQEEVSKIETIKATREKLSYGHLPATEAFILPDGTYAGFTTKFCELLTNLFDIEIVQEFREWDDLIKRLDERSIDFTGELTKTPGRMRFYHMSHYIAARSLKIFTLAGTDEIASEHDINGLRIGFREGSVIADSIKNTYRVSFEVVDFDNYDAATAKLKSGEIDAFVYEAVTDYAFQDYGVIRSKEFFPLIFMPVSLTTANPELEPIISVVDKYIAAGGLDNLYKLYKEGDEEYAKYKLKRSLTAEERAYLGDLAARGAKVPVAFEYENYPVSFYNETDGEFQGFAIDILDEISNLTGIVFEDAGSKGIEWEEMLEGLKTGDISMITQLLYSDKRSDDYIWSSVPYAYSYYALISKADYPDLANYQVARSRVGNISKTAFEDLYHQCFPDSDNVTTYANQNDALNALEKGEIDLVMASEYMMLTQANYRENTGYKVNIRFNAPMDSLFGFNKKETVLRSIIDKAQAYIKTDTIVNRWTDRIFDYSSKLMKELMSFLVIFLILLILVLITVIFLFVKNKRLGKELEKIAYLDGLTGIFNRRHFMEQALLQVYRSQRLNCKSFVVIFDLDHFKLVNDKYGHLAGDETLRSVAARAKNAVRPYDLFARYGGEEFILLITDVDEAIARELAERIRRIIAEKPIEFEGVCIPISASFGVAIATPVNDLETAIKLADIALYKAKDRGRNRIVLHDE